MRQVRADFLHDGGAGGGERCAGETALFAAVRVVLNRAFVEGGVGGDDAVHVRFGNGVEGGVKRGVVKVGRDFDHNRHAARGFDREALLFGLDAREQFAQCRAVLQLAQSGGVGRGDVDGEVVGVRPGFLQANAVVGKRFFVRRVLVFAEVNTEQCVRPGRGGEAGDEGVYATVVEAHAVDDGFMFWQAEQARLRVARLRPRGDSADFDEAETGAVKGADGDTVFVQPGGEAEAVGEGQAHEFNRLVAAVARHERGHPRQQGEGAVVGAFGVEAEKEGAEVVVGVHHGFSSRRYVAR